MHKFELSTVRSIVIAEVERGVVIDVEIYCQQLQSLFPGLSRKEFEDYILQATMDAGGNAVWGGSTRNSERHDPSDPGVQPTQTSGGSPPLRHQ